MTGSDFNALPPPWVLLIIVAILCPLGVWKAVEIVCWVACHIH